MNIYFILNLNLSTLIRQTRNKKERDSPIKKKKEREREIRFQKDNIRNGKPRQRLLEITTATGQPPKLSLAETLCFRFRDFLIGHGVAQASAEEGKVSLRFLLFYNSFFFFCCCCRRCRRCSSASASSVRSLPEILQGPSGRWSLPEAEEVSRSFSLPLLSEAC